MSRIDKMSAANIVLCIASMVCGFIAMDSKPADISFEYAAFGTIATFALCGGLYFLGRADEARKQATA